MSVSLIGIIIVQALWISHAIKTERAAFDRAVYDALKRGVDNVERDEIFMFMDKRIDLPEPPEVYFRNDLNIDSIVKIHTQKLNTPDHNTTIISTVSTTDGKESRTVVIYNDTIDNNFHIKANQPTKVKINTNFFTDSHFEGIKELEGINDYEIEFQLNSQLLILEDQLDSFERVILLEIEKDLFVTERLSKFQKNIDKWVVEYQFENERFDYLSHTGDINNIISEALINNGIELEYHYQLIKNEKDSSVVIKSQPDTSIVLPFKYKTELYPTDFFRSGTYITLDFPGINKLIYRSVALLIIGSLVFTIIILITFGFTLYYIQKQKKISEIKSDFINNMTHEFKTPIATISLASSAIESPKVMGNSEKTSYYIDIIKKENKRMNSQVERVLQMAQIDNHDFNLNLKKTDIHEIIVNVANVLLLRANDKGGRIITSLKASCQNISIDEVHFSNVLNNLIDNALKYNNNPPEILLETSIRNGRFILEVSDNGHGMNKEVQKHVFDKFYRKPSGNIHNVKGFGLGLSYVKAIIEAHGGEVSVDSEVDNGSKFTITLKCV